jgi:lysophospholipase L1-like esterase
MTEWTPGDISGSQTLSDLPSPEGDRLYAEHINEIRRAVNLLERKDIIRTIGDSLTSYNIYQKQVALLLAGFWKTINNGVSGNTTSQMLARFQSDIINPLDSKYVIIWAGVNDVRYDVAVGTVESNLQAMYTAAHDAGIKVISVNISPFKGFTGDYPWTSDRQVALDLINTWIASTAINVDYKIDVYSVLEDPNIADTLLAAYSSDGLHLSTDGYNLVGTTIVNGSKGG